MKVVLVSGSLPDIRCGIGDYTARLAAELASLPDLSVTVIASASERVRTDAASPARVLATGRWGLAALPALVRSIAALEPDVVHVQYPAVGYGRALGIVLLPLALRLWSRLPTTLTIHERRERGWGARLAIDLMAVFSRRVMVFDPLEASDLRRSLRGLLPPVEMVEMISTIPVQPGVDRTATRAGLGATAGDLVVVSFGLLHPRRRIEDIIDAVASLRSEGTPARLLVLGGEAEYDLEAAHRYSESLRRRVADLGLEEATSWLDHLEPARVSAVLRSSDVAVLLYPGGVSGRNTTLKAALEHLLAVVTTVGPATPEAMRGLAGVTFLPSGAYEVRDLADAILAAHRTGATAAGTSGLRGHADLHLEVYRRVQR